MAHREQIEWCDVWIEGGDTASLPRALLVGDSIVKSYYPHVHRRIAETFALARLATSKCVSDPSFVRELALVLGEYEFATIHFNNEPISGGIKISDKNTNRLLTAEFYPIQFFAA